MYKKINRGIIGFVLLVSLFFGNLFFQVGSVYAQEKTEKLEYILFHLDTCPHCKDEIKFIENKLLPKYGEFIDYKEYELSTQKNREVLDQYSFFYKVDVGSGVPIAFIGGEIVHGYGDDDTTGKQIMGIVESKLSELGLIDSKQDEVKKDDSSEMSVPILGEIDAKSISLPFLTVVLGLVDGFNPCAMWVLLFLISLLFGMNDKKKMWILGSVFIFISGFSYFLFMSAWLHLVLFLGLISFIRAGIGLLAIGMGSLTIHNFWENRKVDGVVCKVSSNKKNQKVFDSLRNAVHKKSLLLSIIGIVVVAFLVNLLELACSAGFPAIFTQVLAINDIAMWQRYMYMIGYVFFYMLDDMIIFALAMITMQATGIGTKYAKYVNLFSGILIFILGLLLIFKPEFLMFS
jgi:hypothetical protein